MPKKNDLTAKRRRWGKLGGLVGGPARAKALSKSRRSEIARMGYLAMLEKARARK